MAITCSVSIHYSAEFGCAGCAFSSKTEYGTMAEEEIEGVDGELGKEDDSDNVNC